MKLELAHLLQPRVLVEFAQDHLWDRLPWALLALGVVFGGALVIWIIKLILSRIFIPKYRERYVLLREEKSGEKFYTPTRRMRWGSFAHLMLETFFFVSIVIVLWIAAHIAGFNFWTSSLVGVGLGAVGTYIFGAALQNIGAGYFVFLTDKVEEGWFISVGQYKGRIIEIHPLYVEIEAKDPVTKGALHHQIPMIMLLSTVVTRYYYEEYYAPILSRKDDPTAHLVGTDPDLLLESAPSDTRVPVQEPTVVVGRGTEPTRYDGRDVHRRGGPLLPGIQVRENNSKIEHRSHEKRSKKGQ